MAGPRGARLLALLLAGLVLEAALVVGLLVPFNLHALPRPLQPGESLATILGEGWGGALHFVVPVLLAFATYTVGWLLLRRCAPRGALVVVLAGTVLFSLTLLPINPVGAQDVYHNIADARTYWVYGQNPTRIPPGHFADDPLARQVYTWSGFPSSYGPLWYQLSGAPLPFSGTGVRANVIGQKALTIIFLWGSTILAALVAEGLRPGAGAASALLLGWNPLLQFATAGNAHNDIVMVFFALAALYALVRRWWLAVLPLLTLAVATKQVWLLVVPIFLLWLWRRPDVPRRGLALSLVLSALVAVALYAPLLAGHGYAGLAHESSHVISSPGALLALGLQHGLGLSWNTATTAIKPLILPFFALGYLLLLRRAASAPDARALISCAFWVVFLYLLLAKWWYWPWYAEWVVALAAPLAGGPTAPVALATSLGAMLAYATYYWLGDSFALQNIATALAAFLPALLVLAALGFLAWLRPASEYSGYRSRDEQRPAAR
ncbi:MAG TPA: hypothetical protein VFI42_01580 [Thermomicrobiaceae bacterium]|nr:hypothetical protein [Thermomicrobiaceae bacterium]